LETILDKKFWLIGAALALVHLVFALLFANLTPFKTQGILLGQRGTDGRPLSVPDVGAPDELPHIVYMEHLKAGEGIPVLDPRDPDLGRTYQSHQPPLFYGLAVQWSGIFGESALGMRSINAVFGGLTVLGVLALGWWGTKRRDVAVIAAGFTALLPMHIALSGAVSNDPLLFCLCTWSLAMLALISREAESGLCSRNLIILGLLAGLAFVTKTSSLALLPTILVAIILLRKQIKWTEWIPGAVIALGIGGAWWVRNYQVYGDPFAIKIFQEAFVGSPKAAMFQEAFGAYTYWTQWVGWWTGRSLIGVFGYMDIFLPNPVYGIGLLLLVALFVIGLLQAMREEDPASRRTFGMGAVFGGVTFLQFLQFNSLYFQGQARYLLPGIGALALPIALGGTPKGRVVLGAILLVALLALDIYLLTWLPGQFAIRAVII
jgi:4-amino-4-deoxy-L-arabinose transferase-like glycosyltransferase